MTPYVALFSSVLIMFGVLLSEKKNRSNCQSRTLRGEQCKRMVPLGQKFCSQHLHGWKAKLRAISRNPSASFYGTVLSIAISIAMGVGSPRYPSVVMGPQSEFDRFKGTPVTYAQLESLRSTQQWPTETLRTQDSVKVSATRKKRVDDAPMRRQP
jgi:hypothetical protein